MSGSDELTVVLAGSRPDAGLGCDGHQRLPDGLLPALTYDAAHARGSQDRVVVRAADILPDVVDHGGSDDLEAVRVAALREAAEVLRRLHLQDLRQRDLLEGEQRLV